MGRRIDLFDGRHQRLLVLDEIFPLRIHKIQPFFLALVFVKCRKVDRTEGPDFFFE